MERYRPDRRGSSGGSEISRLNPVSISCLAATISAVTVLYRMCGDGSVAGIRRISSEKSVQLVADGVVEVMLLGQNVNSYGKTLESPISFAELLRQIEKIEGLKRIRFMTSHPKDLSDELIEVMSQSPRRSAVTFICRFRPEAARILKEMNRRYTKEALSGTGRTV